MFRVGVALLAVGATGKFAIKTYRKIKNKEFFSAQTLAKDYYKGAFQSPMTRREALLILNLREGFDSGDIKKNHQKIMLINHPDNGTFLNKEGSTYVATKVNEAKEVLLKP